MCVDHVAQLNPAQCAKCSLSSFTPHLRSRFWREPSAVRRAPNVGRAGEWANALHERLRPMDIEGGSSDMARAQRGCKRCPLDQFTTCL